MVFGTFKFIYYFKNIRINNKMMGLKINEEKTKYVRLSAVEAHRSVRNITIGQ